MCHEDLSVNGTFTAEFRDWLKDNPGTLGLGPTNNG